MKNCTHSSYTLLVVLPLQRFIAFSISVPYQKLPDVASSAFLERFETADKVHLYQPFSDFEFDVSYCFTKYTTKEYIYCYYSGALLVIRWSRDHFFKSMKNVVIVSKHMNEDAFSFSDSEKSLVANFASGCIHPCNPILITVCFFWLQLMIPMACNFGKGK